MKPTVFNYVDHERVQVELERVTAERDAAVADLHHNDACSICVGSSVPETECSCECESCKLDCRCRDCQNESNWQWRGTDKGGKL